MKRAIRLEVHVSLLDSIMGRPLANREEESQKVGPLAGIPMLGLDALSSAAYGPEASLTILLVLGSGSLQYILPVTLVIVALLSVVYFSYRQTISAYPGGGGSYTVAKENLGNRFGLLAAASLMLDYILNVSVGIAAGAGSLVSVAPFLHPYILPVCLLILGLITLVNLHGVRESGVAFMLPAYVFTGTLAIVIVAGIFKAVASGGHPAAVELAPALPAATAGAGVWVLLRSFANGCTAMTGVEAISNGIGAFKAPAVKNAQATLTAVIAILALLLTGIAFLCHSYGIGATDPDSDQYQSVLSQLTAAVAGRGAFYYVTMTSVIMVVCLSANTSFADFPRLCRLLALDKYLPASLAQRGRRLVYSEGIVILAVMSGLLLTVFGGITDRLIPLFAIGAFGAFTLSQAGMVVHWLQKRDAAATAVKRYGAMAMNATGAVSTAIVLAIVLVTKFTEGAWIILVLVPALFWLFTGIKRHYVYVARKTNCELPAISDDFRPPYVVLVMRNWSVPARKALRFAMELSPDVVAVHINFDNEDPQSLKRKWVRCVEEPLRLAGHTQVPQLLCVESPYRRFFHPLFETLKSIEAEQPDRTIAVVIPELVGSTWYDYFLHNRLTTALKAAVLLNGDQRITVVNVPWYLDRSA